MASFHTKVLILGSGPAGLTAAIYAARANLSPIWWPACSRAASSPSPSDVENYPGYAKAKPKPNKRFFLFSKPNNWLAKRKEGAALPKV